MTAQTTDEARRALLVHNLDRVRARISAACAAVGRQSDTVCVIAVTKRFPATDVRLLTEAGVLDMGENRDQEAAPKVAACADLRPQPRWHFVGQLQRNKARSVVRYADVVHSVDRAELVTALSGAVLAIRRDRPLDVLIQVDLRPMVGGAAGVLGARGGVPPDGVAALAEAVTCAVGLRLGGLMAVAPQQVDPGVAFAAAAECAARLRADHPGADWLSAGMSGDLEVAVRNGATHLRVGTALLGDRPPLAR